MAVGQTPMAQGSLTMSYSSLSYSFSVVNQGVSVLIRHEMATGAGRPVVHCNSRSLGLGTGIDRSDQSDRAID